MKASFPLVIVFMAGAFFTWSATAQEVPPVPEDTPPAPLDTTETMSDDHEMTVPGTDPEESIYTVEFVLNEAPDDHPVTLSGTLTVSLGDEHFTFLDDTGSITVRIDDDTLSPDMYSDGLEVEIVGEVDKDTGEQTIVEVEELTTK